jgi:hypothetical protein
MNQPSLDSPADRQRLSDFFGDLEELLEWSVRYRRRLLRPDVADSLSAAWYELKPSFESVRRGLEEATFEDLRLRGLTGSQLALKLDAFDRQKKSFDKYKKIVEEGGRVVRFLRRLRWRTPTRQSER